MIGGEVLFQDRRDAGRKLAAALSGSPRPDLVLALPRGGVPVAYEVAKALDAPLDLLIVRKIGAPGHEEFGIGAVVDGDDPQTVLNERAMNIVQPSEAYVRSETERQLREIERRRAVYFGDRRPHPVEGQSIVLVDDGIATGGTVRVALRGLRKAKAGKIVLAVPVAPPDTLEEFAEEADEVVCLSAPEFFRAVGVHYADFTQTTDDDVVALLAEFEKQRHGDEAAS